MLDQVNAELDRLSSLEPIPARIEPVSLGKTFKQHWETLDVVGRNEFLRASEVRAQVEPWTYDDAPVDYSNAYNGPVDLLFDRPVAVPVPDDDGRMVTIYGHGVRIVIDLGNLAQLRDMAASA